MPCPPCGPRGPVSPVSPLSPFSTFGPSVAGITFFHPWAPMPCGPRRPSSCSFVKSEEGVTLVAHCGLALWTAFASLSFLRTRRSSLSLASNGSCRADRASFARIAFKPLRAGVTSISLGADGSLRGASGAGLALNALLSLWPRGPVSPWGPAAPSRRSRRYHLGALRTCRARVALRAGRGNARVGKSARRGVPLEPVARGLVERMASWKPPSPHPPPPAKPHRPSFGSPEAVFRRCLPAFRARASCISGSLR